MLVTLAYCLRDHDITLQLVNWMASLGSYKPRHTLLLCHDHRCPKNTVQAILDAARPIFTDVRDLEAKAPIDGWPEGANYMFRTVNSYLANNATNVKHFLWLEPDAIPLKKFWLDDLEGEYETGGKPFMGDDVNVEDIPRHMSGVGIYPNPIYDFAGEANRAADIAWDMSAKDQIVPQAHFTKLIEHAWKHPTFNTLDELKTQIRPEAVLFHASKDGSLIKLLREEQQRSEDARGVKAVLPQEPVLVHAGIHTPPVDCPVSSNEGENPSPLPPRTGSFPHPDQMHAATHPGPVDAGIFFKGGDATCRQEEETIQKPILATSNAAPTVQSVSAAPIYDIFIRTYPVDYPWLNFCIRSIKQFATGFRKIWIITPDTTVGLGWEKNYQDVELKVMNEESQDGYLSQQIHKLYADTITNYEADYILHIDSDTLFTRPVTPQDFFALHVPGGTIFAPGEKGILMDGSYQVPKLIWYYTPYEHTETPWKVITQKFLGEAPPFEFMRRLPMMIPSWLYPELRTFCFQKHKKNLGDYVRAQPYREFSEFNALGAYAWKFHHDKFHWVDTLAGEMPKPFARQFFSWGGLTEEVKAEIQNILSGVSPSESTRCESMSDTGSHGPAQSTLSGNDGLTARPSSPPTGVQGGDASLPTQTSSGVVETVNTVGSESTTPSSLIEKDWNKITKDFNERADAMLKEGGYPAQPFNGADDETPGDHVRWLERYVGANPSRRQYVMAQLKKVRLVPLKRGKVKQK